MFNVLAWQQYLRDQKFLSNLKSVLYCNYYKNIWSNLVKSGKRDFSKFVKNALLPSASWWPYNHDPRRRCETFHFPFLTFITLSHGNTIRDVKNIFAILHLQCLELIVLKVGATYINPLGGVLQNPQHAIFKQSIADFLVLGS